MRLLIVTNHETHASYDSIYEMARSLHEARDGIDCFITSLSFNGDVFNGQSDVIEYRRYSDEFSFSNLETFFSSKKSSQGRFCDFDAIFFRMDRQVGHPDSLYDFFNFVGKSAPKAKFVNSPRGLWETRSKEFLKHFREICPRFKIVSSLRDAFLAFENEAFVLKPLDGYGGRGIIKLNSMEDISTEDGDFEGEDAQRFLNSLPDSYFPVMAMSFLKNVTMGDKRIVVSAGDCLGAVLRKPKDFSWLANLAQGATSAPAELSAEEIKIIERVNPVLEESGILFYGIDTLVDNNGKRVLSEINTTNVGGLLQIKNTSSDSIFKVMANGLLECLLKMEI